MNDDAQASIKSILLTVVGQAFSAAGFHLVERPVQQAAGQYRFGKQLENGLFLYIIFQFLVYVNTEWAAGMPSRFKVSLVRSDFPEPSQTSEHPEYIQRDLSDLVVADFKVQILPHTGYWWPFSTQSELGQALAEAGHLVIGFGIPWLQGELQLPTSD